MRVRPCIAITNERGEFCMPVLHRATPLFVQPLQLRATHGPAATTTSSSCPGARTPTMFVGASVEQLGVLQATPQDALVMHGLRMQIPPSPQCAGEHPRSGGHAPSRPQLRFLYNEMPCTAYGTVAELAHQCCAWVVAFGGRTWRPQRRRRSLPLFGTRQHSAWQCPYPRRPAHTHRLETHSDAPLDQSQSIADIKNDAERQASMQLGDGGNAEASDEDLNATARRATARAHDEWRRRGELLRRMGLHTLSRCMIFANNVQHARWTPLHTGLSSDASPTLTAHWQSHTVISWLVAGHCKLGAMAALQCSVSSVSNGDGDAVFETLICTLTNCLVASHCADPPFFTSGFCRGTVAESSTQTLASELSDWICHGHSTL